MIDLDERYMRRIGGEDAPLKRSDLNKLRAGVHRVWELLRDGRWHTAPEICLAAGENGIPASEGLRRMRELRAIGVGLEKRRDSDSRMFQYRIKSVAGEGTSEMPKTYTGTKIRGKK